MRKLTGTWGWVIVAPALAGVGLALWPSLRPQRPEDGFFVHAGQVPARMDTQQLEARRRETEAQREQTRHAVATATSQVAQRLSEKEAAVAVLA